MTTKIPVGTPYFQDHGFGRWPEEWADVEFSISRSGDSLKLVAPGFGELSGDYGNGAIWITEADWLRAHPTESQPTAPKLPEGLEPVAWRYKTAHTTHLCHSRLDHYFSNDEGQTYIKGEPLVRLSGAKAALQALAAEKERKELQAALRHAGLMLVRTEHGLCVMKAITDAKAGICVASTGGGHD